MTNVQALPAPRPRRGTEIVASNVRGLIGYKGMSQAELSKALGLGEMAMSRRMKAHTGFDADEIVQIAEFFGVAPGYLFEERLQMTEATNTHLDARPGTPGEQKDSQITKGSLATVTRLQPRTPAFERATLAPVTHIGA